MIHVRDAARAELPAVRNVLDGAMLEPGVPDLDTAIAEGAVLVAVREASDAGAETVLGVLVLDGGEIVAIAVRPRRRGQGIGTTLVDAAADRRERLRATFRADVRPFWESVGFDVQCETEEGRYRGSATD